MACKHRPGQVIELLPTRQTAISLSGALMLVPALFSDLVRIAVLTPHPLRPAMCPDYLKTLIVVQQVQQVHGQPSLPLAI